jgi:hypothetical protein
MSKILEIGDEVLQNNGGFSLTCDVPSSPFGDSDVSSVEGNEETAVMEVEYIRTTQVEQSFCSKAISLGKPATVGASDVFVGSSHPFHHTSESASPQAISVNTFKHLEENATSTTNSVAGKHIGKRSDHQPQKQPRSSFALLEERSAGTALRPKTASLDQDGRSTPRAALMHSLLLSTSVPPISSVDPVCRSSKESRQGQRYIPVETTFYVDTVLNRNEMELLWLGEESMCCLYRTEFDFDFVWEYASESLRMELRKFSPDSSENQKIMQIVRTEDIIIGKRFTVREASRNWRYLNMYWLLMIISPILLDFERTGPPRARKGFSASYDEIGYCRSPLAAERFETQGLSAFEAGGVRLEGRLE